mgnify:CR=1 FL=1|jgi:hypothetical protein
MLGFHHLALKVENWIIAHYYSHTNTTIFKGLIFFLNNIFYTEEEKKNILNNFCRVQKTRYILLRAIKKFKAKKHSVNDSDMLMVPFTEYRDNLKVYISENEQIYTFYLLDLLKMWKKNIYESNFMIISPKNLRNPYTNKVFNETTLNYIYLSAYKEMLMIPTAITEQFKVQYNKLKFINNYGTMLQEKAITNFVFSDNLDLFRDIITIKQLYPTITYNIDITMNDFSLQEELIKNMRHILLIYYEFSYSTNFVKKETARLNFLNKLREYNENIPIQFRPHPLPDSDMYDSSSDNDELFDSFS